MADHVLFLTELVGLPVYDLRGRRIGRLSDAAVVPLFDAVRIDRYFVGGGWSWLTIRHDQVASVSLDGIHLGDEKLIPYHDDEYMLRLVRDLLDQQIIDVNGRKVVRVNDVTFETRGHELHVLEVDVGIRSIVRRLFQGVVPPRWIRRLQQPIAPNSIRWDFCNIVEPDPQRRLRLNISHQKLENLHPADLADIVEELGSDEREAIFETLDSEVAADALSEVEDPKMQAQILEALEPEKAAEIIEEMSPDEAADVLGQLEEETSEEILEEMDAEPENEVRELLEFPKNTAGGLMNTEYLGLGSQATVADAIEQMREKEYLLDSLSTVHLVDGDGRLTGVVPVAKLFLAGGDTELASLAAEPLIHVDVDTKKGRVTETFDKYNLLSLPVVDREGRLAGVITADDIISVLRES